MYGTGCRTPRAAESAELDWHRMPGEERWLACLCLRRDDILVTERPHDDCGSFAKWRSHNDHPHVLCRRQRRGNDICHANEHARGRRQGGQRDRERYTDSKCGNCGQTFCRSIGELYGWQRRREEVHQQARVHENQARIRLGQGPQRQR